MSNSVKGEVTFENGGKNYTFKLGINAQVLIESKSGLPMSKYLNQDRIKDLGASDVRLIFWAGLMRQHPEITEDAVGDLIDELGIERVAEIFLKAFETAKGNGPENNVVPQKPAKARIGMNS